MKNKYKILISSVMAISLVLGGCSLNKDETLKPTEYLTDNENTESVEETSNDAASSDQSIVVVENLFEPILEALNEENVTSATEEATEETSTS